MASASGGLPESSSPLASGGAGGGVVVPDFLEELDWRGLLHQCTATGEDARGKHKELRDHLADPVNNPRAAYIGYDPTADSLTIGNLVTIMLLVHFQRAGHQPVVVMGGGTGLIGDPSGKSAERTLMTEERVRANVEAQRSIFGRVFENAAKFEGRRSAEGAGAGGAHGFTPPIVNNMDWLGKLGFLEALRDIGKHFSVNEMIKKDSVRTRLEQRDQGISFTEFTYQLLQSYDYYYLYKHSNKLSLMTRVTMQMGGSDQWGNIVGGIEYIKREGLKPFHDSKVVTITPDPWATQREMNPLSFARLGGVFGLTCPLITKADGGKFGKTESGAIWLTAPQAGESGDALKSRTTAYGYYQFWLNASDADVGKFLRIFTLHTRDRIEEIEREHAKDPAKRLGQKELARAATFILHGDAGVREAEGATAALFGGKKTGDGDGAGGAGGGGGDLRSLSLDALNQAFSAAPSTQHAKTQLDGQGLSLIELLPQTTLAKSKTEARTFLTEGSISVNGEVVAKETALARRLTPGDLLHGQVIALRRGKKSWHITRWA